MPLVTKFGEARTAIEQLHDLYGRLTRQSLTLNIAREYTWFEWLRWRPREPFTEADLAAVVAYLQREIRARRRNLGALKFSNLVGQPDYFEEDLALAAAAGRKAEMGKAESRNRTEVLRASGRTDRTDRTDGTERSLKQVLASPEFKELQELKRKLEP